MTPKPSLRHLTHHRNRGVGFWIVVIVGWLLILMGLSLLFSSCNPVKRIQKHEDQFDEVGRLWLKKNPCVNDSSVVYVKGDTVTYEHTDTVYYDPGIEDPNGHDYIDTTVKHKPCVSKIITRVVTKAVHDTVKVVVKDIQEDKLCRDDLSKTKDELAKSKLKEASGKKWVWISISLLLVCLGLGYLQIKKLFV